MEYQIRGITQIPVNEKKGLTFARGLRSILRHDPDKILVGEIRDAETAQIAINSALTGHLVFTTVHANNVVDVLGRFLNMGVEPYNFVSALNCILAQRLVRQVCEFCVQEMFLQRGGAGGERVGAGGVARVQLPRGRRDASSAAGRGIAGGRRSTSCWSWMTRFARCCWRRSRDRRFGKKARDKGMGFLRDSALERVRAGITTLKEINKVTFIEAGR